MSFPNDFTPLDTTGTFTIEIRTATDNVLVATVFETNDYEEICNHLAVINIEYAMSLTTGFTAEIVRKESKNDD